MTRSEMREHVFKLIFRVPFHDKNELLKQDCPLRTVPKAYCT